MIDYVNCDVFLLSGEDFSGCRRNQSTSRPNTIELILSDSNVLYLSAKNEVESTEWLQAFCKVISLGVCILLHLKLK